MEKRYLVFTSPVNRKMLDTAPEEFYSSLNQLFQLEFNKTNTEFSGDARMDPAKIHVFENSDYIGWLAVIQEGTDVYEAISTQH